MDNSHNEFQMYERLRAYQLHCQRMQRKNLKVPGHEAYSSPKPSLQQAKAYHKNKRQFRIESENQQIMKKLVNINQRKPHHQSSPNLTLPPIKQNQIPLYQQANGLIAKKIITCKSSINLKEQLSRYKTLEEMKRRISKFDYSGGVSINRKKYVAELLLLKKLKQSRVLNPQI